MINEEELKLELKTLILEETEKEEALSPSELTDDEPLFGSKSRLGLDSLDALQVSVALKERYQVRIQGDRAARKHMHSINTLVAYIISES